MKKTTRKGNILRRIIKLTSFYKMSDEQIKVRQIKRGAKTIIPADQLRSKWKVEVNRLFGLEKHAMMGSK